MAKDALTLTSIRHPEYMEMYAEWIKWRLCYQGGISFRDGYLERYSKREHTDDFILRKKITYIPAHARSAINIIRNALAVRIPDVKRAGSDLYQRIMNTNVDGFNNSINSFMVLDVIPLLLTQGKRFVVVDAPEASSGVTRAEDSGNPYFYALNAENMLSWAYDENGNFSAVLLELTRELTDEDTGLAYKAEQIYRYMKMVPEGPINDPCAGEMSGPGVFVKTMDKSGKTMGECRVLPIDRIPIVEFRLVASLMGEIAEHQIALLNLASTDMDFLWRGNFPIYTQQLPKGVQGIRARGTKARQDGAGSGEDTLTERDPGTTSGDKQRRIGIGKGLTYREGTDRPDFINPGVDNLKVSMEKQDTLIKDIRTLVDLALVSLSVKAVEQSGASKMADRVGEEAGLAYLGRALESGERDMAELFHMMSGEENMEVTVTYPEKYTLKTTDDRIEEAGKLKGLRSAVRSPEYQRRIDKQVAEILLMPDITQDDLAKIHKEIDEAPYFDDDKTRSEIVQKDKTTGLLSAETAAAMRGYGDEEHSRVVAEESARTARIIGGEGDLFGDGDGVDDGSDEEELDENGNPISGGQ